MRSRDLGIVIGRRRPGPGNAITDVAGVRVGHTTLISGDGRWSSATARSGPASRSSCRTTATPGRSRSSPGRTGSTATASSPASSGSARPASWAGRRPDEHPQRRRRPRRPHRRGVSRGARRGAVVVPAGRRRDLGRRAQRHQRLPRPARARATRRSRRRRPGPVAEGGVGGGTGMVCHEFKGGIGTARGSPRPTRAAGRSARSSRPTTASATWLRVDGVPVGEAIPTTDLPSPYDEATRSPPVAGGAARRPAMPPPGSGSIIVLLATDAPLLPHQCERLAQRAGLGLARAGGDRRELLGRPLPRLGDRQPRAAGARGHGTGATRSTSGWSPTGAIDPLFEAAIEATEEAIVNALVAADDDDRPGRDHRPCAPPRPARGGDGAGRTAPARGRRSRG